MSGEPDAVGIADAIRAGRRRAVDVMNAAVAAIETRNPELNAFVHLAPVDDLLAAAAAVDRRVEAGEDTGPLGGVPFGVKDLEDVRGMPTSHGSLLGGDDPAEADSPLVARLRAAGAIVVGKTNTPEFGYSIDTGNRRFGRTRNPIDPERTPGGSSGGSAAAVAAEMVPLATGSDGGGSIRIPAAFCRLPGLKTTPRMIPAARDTWGDLSTPGCLSRSVRDVARFLDVASRRPRVPLEESLADPLPLPGLRALASVDLHGAHVDDAVAEAFLEALDLLEAAGVAVKRTGSPLPDSREIFTALTSHGDARRVAGLSDDERARLSRGFLAWCARGAEVTPEQLTAAEADRARLVAAVAELLDGADLLLSPTVGVLPWRIGERLQGDPMEFLLTHPFNLTGHPAVTVPLPEVMAGLQAAARPLSEDLLLRFADVALALLEERKETR